MDKLEKTHASPVSVCSCYYILARFSIDILLSFRPRLRSNLVSDCSAIFIGLLKVNATIAARHSRLSRCIGKRRPGERDTAGWCYVRFNSRGARSGGKGITEGITARREPQNSCSGRAERAMA